MREKDGEQGEGKMEGKMGRVKSADAEGEQEQVGRQTEKDA